MHRYTVQAGFCWKCELHNWETYLGITRGLTQPQRTLGVSVASHVNGLHPSRATLLSGKK